MLVNALAQAIAQFEGFYQSGSLAQRNRNPGNLRAGPRSIGTNSGYAVYASDADGWADLQRQIQLNINRGLTLDEFFGGKPGVYDGYAPAADNNPVPNYVAFVSGRAGIPRDVPLAQLVSGVSIPAAAAPAAAVSSFPLLDVARSAAVRNTGWTTWGWPLIAAGTATALFLWMESQ